RVPHRPPGLPARAHRGLGRRHARSESPGRRGPAAQHREDATAAALGARALMRVWKGVVLVDLALAVGLGWGYLWWGQRTLTLQRDLAAARLVAATTGEREYHATGVVRAELGDLGMIVLTHGEIPGYMPAMTMGFRLASPKI